MPATRKPTRQAPIERVIDDLDALRAVSDPLRLKIVELTATDPSRGWTAKELAASLGTSQTKLYHHLALLEEHGFLRVAETRIVSGITERRYAATAHGFHVDRGLFAGTGGEAAMAATLDAIFEKARGEIVTSLHTGLINPADPEPGHPRMALSVTDVRLSPAGVRKVMRQIERLKAIDDLDEADGAHYGFLLAFYPRTSGDSDR
jgi:DNA-binding transcriptional ArsR family regulator